MTDREHLQWIYDRLSQFYAEDLKVDYMVRLQSIIDSMGPRVKKLAVVGIKTCMECPYIVNTGREQPWCGHLHKVVGIWDEVSDDDDFSIPEWCELEDDDD